MLKDRYIFALLLCACLALTACDLFDDDDDDEESFPDRAPSANNLLRHYYDSNTFPDDFTAIKIPEGDSFDDDELTIEMPMGGTELVDDVRVRLYITPPGTPSESGVELECRVKAPDGTTSGWQVVDFEDPEGSGLERLNPQAEVRFANDFTDVISGGEWLIQLRDPVEDEDGRAVFRNATLRLNGGLPVGSSSGTENQQADEATNPYDKPLPVRKGGTYTADIANIGVNKVLSAEFVFTNSFNVESFELTFTIRHNGSANPTEQLRIAVMSPSGGWYIPTQIPDPDAEFISPSPTDDTTWVTYTLSQSRADNEVADSFIFLGEPAGGTWTLLLWESEADSNAIYFSDDEATDSTTLATGVEASMTLG